MSSSPMSITKEDEMQGILSSQEPVHQPVVGSDHPKSKLPTEEMLNTIKEDGQAALPKISSPPTDKDLKVGINLPDVAFSKKVDVASFMRKMTMSGNEKIRKPDIKSVVSVDSSRKLKFKPNDRNFNSPEEFAEPMTPKDPTSQVYENTNWELDSFLANNTIATSEDMLKFNGEYETVITPGQLGGKSMRGYRQHVPIGVCPTKQSLIPSITVNFIDHDGNEVLAGRVKPGEICPIKYSYTTVNDENIPYENHFVMKTRSHQYDRCVVSYLFGNRNTMLCEALVLGHKLCNSDNKRYDHILLVDNSKNKIPDTWKRLLSQVWSIQEVNNNISDTLGEDECMEYDTLLMRFHTFCLTQYRLVLIVELDILIVGDINEIFEKYHPPAAIQSWNEHDYNMWGTTLKYGDMFTNGTSPSQWLNGGVWLIKPSIDIYNRIITVIKDRNMLIEWTNNREHYMDQILGQAELGEWTIMSPAYNFVLGRLFWEELERVEFFANMYISNAVHVIHFVGKRGFFSPSVGNDLARYKRRIDGMDEGDEKNSWSMALSTINAIYRRYENATLHFLADPRIFPESKLFLSEVKAPILYKHCISVTTSGQCENLFHFDKMICNGRCRNIHSCGYSHVCRHPKCKFGLHIYDPFRCGNLFEWYFPACLDKFRKI